MSETPVTNTGNQDAARRRRKGMTALIAGGVSVGMLGMAFAAVPLYQLFCQVTGFAGTTQRSDTVADEILDRLVTVQFDSNAAAELGWDFRPRDRRVLVRVGEPIEIVYLATNNTDHPTTGTALFNVTPETVGGYFVKVACFCFAEQTLAPGETAEMPVLFYVDPAIEDRPNLDYVDTITLSYTFFAVPEAQLGPVADTTVAGDG
jgi:cytochrome c oxidase assembly protein subunit 11